MTEKNAVFGMPETQEETIARLTHALAESNQKLLDAGVDQVDSREGTGPIDSQGFPKEYVRLEIFPGRGPQDLSYVPLAIGGYAVKVTRGKEVILPKVFAEVLEHAVEEVTIQSEGGLVTRPALRFPYQLRGTATEAEYQQFRKQMQSDGKAAAAARA